MFSPVDRYRIDLATAVRRLSRAQSNETAIDEMVSHFDGLYQEELRAEAVEAKAEKNARKRMGSIYKIAFQIVNSPDRTRKGMRTQALTFALFAVIVPIFICLIMGVHWWFIPQYNNRGLYTITGILFGSGIVAGFGIAVARRMAWKPLAIFTIASFGGTGLMVNNSLPETQKSKKELSNLVASQTNLEPRVAKIEAQVKNILNLKDQSPETWKKELSLLPALVQEGNVPYFKEDGVVGGAYPYPSNIANNWRDETLTYTVTLSRTDDLSVAKAAWMKNSDRNALLSSDLRNRENTFKFWRECAANQSTLWTKGYIFSGEVCLRLGAIFSLFAILGYLLGTVRVFGLDWLRLSRG